MTADPLAGLQEAVAAARDAWREASSGDDLVSPRALSSHALVAVNEAITRLGRVIAGVHAPVAAEIAHRSRPELGAESLAKQQGFRSPVALIAATAGTSNGDAAASTTTGGTSESTGRARPNPSGSSLRSTSIRSVSPARADARASPTPRGRRGWSSTPPEHVAGG